jgi:hypothetical protein
MKWTTDQIRKMIELHFIDKHTCQGTAEHLTIIYKKTFTRHMVWGKIKRLKDAHAIEKSNEL